MNGTEVSGLMYILHICRKAKEKKSRYRPGVAQSVPGS